MPNFLKLLANVAVTLVISAAGGSVFEILGIPVSWLSGGMIAVAVAAFFGVPVVVPETLRTIVYFIVGLSMGSAVTPESLHGLEVWPLSVLAMIVVVVLITLTSFTILRRRGGWSVEDAFLASTPGALTLIVGLAEGVKADVPRIVTVQSLRVALLVLTLPPLLSLLAPTAVEVDLGARGGEFSVLEFLLLAVGGLAGYAACRLVRLPNAFLLGSLLGSATLHATGQVEVAVPVGLLVPALIVVGAILGSRFGRISWPTLRRSLVDGLLTFLATVALSLAAAAGVAELLAFSLGQTALAFAPGGFDVMIVMAFALGVDPAYVAAHHTVRFVGISIALPLFLSRRRNT